MDLMTEFETKVEELDVMSAKSEKKQVLVKKLMKLMDEIDKVKPPPPIVEAVKPPLYNDSSAASFDTNNVLKIKKKKSSK